MKKLVLILSVFALASCGGSSASSEAVVDSTVVDSVVVDTTSVVDTTATVVDPVTSGGGSQDGSIIK